MFYSQRLLSSNGPLGAIWLAAHFHRKLKKSQVLQTNITSSIDYIIKDPIEVPIALRISGYLLLGVVRIYSKKVDYLYDDCNETLTKLRTSCGTIEVSLPAPSNVAPFHSITLPDKFDLDALDIEELGYSSKDSPDQYVKTYEEISLYDDAEQHENLDWVLGYHMGEASWHSIPTHNLSMEDEILPPHPMDADFSIDELNGFDNEAPVEKIREKHIYDEIRELATVEVHEQSDAEWQSRRLEGQPASVNKSSHEPKRLRKTKIFDLEQVQIPSKESAMLSSPLPQSPEMGPRSSAYDSVTPELIALRTPKKHEEDWKSRKRKLPFKKPVGKALLFDDTIILSNEVMRNRLNDTSRIVRSHKRIPLSGRSSRLSSMQQMFLEPLIPCMSPKVREFLAEGLGEHKPKVHGVEPSESAAVDDTTPMLDGTPTEEEHFASLAGDKQPELPSKKRLKPRRLVLSNDNPDGVQCKTSDARTENETFHGRSPDFGLNLLNQALNLVAEAESPSDFDGDGNWSIRTRVVAHFLREACKNPKLQNQDKGIKVTQILDGKTRRECARFFMEMLVLKTQDFIHVEQDSPYADIQLRPLPKLDRL